MTFSNRLFTVPSIALALSGIAFPSFFGTDYNVRLEPIPGCVSPTSPAKYEVVTAGEYVKSRLEATYAHSISTE